MWPFNTSHHQTQDCELTLAPLIPVTMTTKLKQFPPVTMVPQSLNSTSCTSDLFHHIVRNDQRRVQFVWRFVPPGPVYHVQNTHSNYKRALQSDSGHLSPASRPQGQPANTGERVHQRRCCSPHPSHHLQLISSRTRTVSLPIH